MVIVFAASLWYLALSLKRHFDRYTYRQELTSVLHETRAKKPYSRGVAWTFIVGGYLISLCLGFLIGAEQVNEKEILDGVLSALFYPPIAVFILDVMYLMNVRLKQW
jgi:multisubunit Na+/H+ antiporter MnhG subunit